MPALSMGAARNKKVFCILFCREDSMYENMKLFSKDEWHELALSLSLSPRQSQIGRHLCSGLSDKQIANAMQISVPTVRTHLSRLFLKFDAQDRNELVIIFFQHFREQFSANA